MQRGVKTETQGWGGLYTESVSNDIRKCGNGEKITYEIERNIDGDEVCTEKGSIGEGW